MRNALAAKRTLPRVWYQGKHISLYDRMMKPRECSRQVRLRMPRKAHDYTGERYGAWTVLRFDHKPTKGASYWICRCDCGAERSVRVDLLRSGRSLSCGCLKSKAISEKNSRHGDSVPSSRYYRLYLIWRSLRYRRIGLGSKLYGLVGLSPRWEKDYMAFKKWSLANGYSDGARLYRINLAKGYEPTNCKWSTDGVWYDRFLVSQPLL